MECQGTLGQERVTVMMSNSGSVITFYSYKGGTGRTSALANVACLLASDPAKRVLAIDFDLEAPGLHRYFPEVVSALDPSLGVIELLRILNDRIDAVIPMSEHDRETHLVQVMSDLPISDYIRSTRMERLDLIAAGAFDSSYPSKVAGFDWVGFYERTPELLLLLSRRLGEQYTHILLDSRTGLNDISGMCTAVLPEKLVIVFTPNEQNVAGASEVVARAVNYRKESDDLRRLVVYPLPSRIENAEPAERDRWRFGDTNGFDGYQPRFERTFREIYGVDECDLSNYFDMVQIQHAPFYSFGEKIAVEIERSREITSLASAYARFATWLERDTPPWAVAVDIVPKYAQTLIERLDGLSDYRIEEGFVVPHLEIARGRVSITEVVSSSPVILTGGAGVGKTNMLRWLAYAFSRRLLGEITTTSADAGDPLLLPVLISAGHLDAEQVTSRTLGELVRMEASRLMTDDVESTAIQTAILTRARLGQLLILLDDVDLAPHSRAFADRVAEFVAAYPQCRVIATARTPFAFFAEGVRVATIQPFDTSQRDELLHRLGNSAADPDLLPHFPWQDEGNPLLIRLCASLAEQIGGVSEFQLLREFVSVLVRRESERSGVTNKALLQVLTKIAMTMVDRGASWIPEREVRRILREARMYVQYEIEDDLDLLGAFLTRDSPGAEWASRVSFVNAGIRDYLAALAVLSNDEIDTRRLQDWLSRSDRLDLMSVFRLAVLAAGESVDAVLHQILGSTEIADEEQASERAIIAAAALAEQPQASTSTAIRIIVAFAAAIRGPRYASYRDLLFRLSRGPWTHLLSEVVETRTPVTWAPLTRHDEFMATLHAADEAEARENYREAVLHHTKLLMVPAIKDEPIYYYMLIRRANARMLLGLYEDALADYQAVIGAGPRDDPAMFSRALYGAAGTLAVLERVDEAISTLRRIHTVMKPADADAIEFLAAVALMEVTVLADSDRFEEALAVIDRLVAEYGERAETAVAGSVAEALLVRAQLLARMERTRESSLALQEVIVRTGRRTDLAAYTQRAQVRYAATLASTGDPEGAVDLLNRVLARHRSSKVEPNEDIELAERLLVQLTSPST